MKTVTAPDRCTCKSSVKNSTVLGHKLGYFQTPNPEKLKHYITFGIGVSTSNLNSSGLLTD